MPNTISVASRVRQLASEMAGRPSEEVDDRSDFRSLGLDSLDYIELVMDLEEEFNVNIPDEDLWDVKNEHRLNSVTDVVAYLREVHHVVG